MLTFPISSDADTFREMLDLLPVAVYRTDRVGLITYFNPAAAQLWGTEPDLGESAFCGSWKLYWPDGRPMAHNECPMALTLADGKPHCGMEAIAERPDGIRVPFIAYPTPIFDTTGRMVGAMNTLVDITERQKHEHTQEHLAAIVQGSDDAIISKDLNGIITSWNPGAERIFGYTTDEAIGQPITMLIPADHIDEEPQILARIRRGDHVDHYETIRQRKDGTRINISLTVSPLRARDGRIVGASKIARDITEIKRQQEQQAILVHEMRHRIKNTLTTVQSIATQTLTDISGEQQRAFRSRLLALAGVHDLLTVDNWRATTLSAVVNQALKPFMETYGCRISINCSDFPVAPDFAQTLSLVLHELATNAVKYGALSKDPGKVTISCLPKPADLRTHLFEWHESGGPPVREPERKGFGTRLIKRAMVDHSTELQYRPDGLYYSVRLVE